MRSNLVIPSYQKKKNKEGRKERRTKKKLAVCKEEQNFLSIQREVSKEINGVREKEKSRKKNLKKQEREQYIKTKII